MSEEKQNKSIREAQALLNMARAVTYQRIVLLDEMTARLRQNKNTCVEEPGGSLALIEEIQTLAQLIHDHASQQLMEQCMPQRCGDCARYKEDCFIKGGRPAYECPSNDCVVTRDDKACGSFEPRPDTSTKEAER